MDIFIFNVELGQCVFFYPRDDKPEYGLMVDCGNTSTFEPIDQILAWGLLPIHTQEYPQKSKLRKLVMTNYDQDHFSGLPYLQKKVFIEIADLPKNISSSELRSIKTVITDPIDKMANMIDTYVWPVPDEINRPPYSLSTYHLTQANFPGEKIDTNKLSQMVFVTYHGTTICIPGDLTSVAWDLHLNNANVRSSLASTNIFIASHHGREDGFNETVFQYCRPEVIVLSDKDIVHTTQEGQSQTYAGQVAGNGIVLNGETSKRRKVLTTRSDGHIWIVAGSDGTRTYRTL